MCADGDVTDSNSFTERKWMQTQAKVFGFQLVNDCGKTYIWSCFRCNWRGISAFKRLETRHVFSGRRRALCRCCCNCRDTQLCCCCSIIWITCRNSISKRHSVEQAWQRFKNVIYSFEYDTKMCTDTLQQGTDSAHRQDKENKTCTMFQREMQINNNHNVSGHNKKVNKTNTEGVHVKCQACITLFMPTEVYVTLIVDVFCRRGQMWVSCGSLSPHCCDFVMKKRKKEKWSHEVNRGGRKWE